MTKKIRKMSNKAMILFVFMLVSSFGFRVNAQTTGSKITSSVTYTGSITYNVISVSYGYYSLGFSSTQVSNSLSEGVILYSSTGIQRPSIVAGGLNTASISTNTSNFSNGYYTTKGIYSYTYETRTGVTDAFAVDWR